MSEKQGIFTLLNGRVTMMHGFYNPTSDAVWLSAFIPTPDKIKTVLDIGIGTGGVSLCILARFPELNITGIDISEEMLDACRINIDLNKRKINLIKQNILEWTTTDRFDLVVTNPPYFKGTPAKHNAHHNTNIKEWIKKSSARVAPNGYICTIVDASCADQVIYCLQDKHFGDIQVFPLFGAKNSAERVLIRAKNGVKTGSCFYCGTSMNNDTILRDGLTVDSLLSTLGTK